MAVTLQDVADKCGFSRATVSHILNDPGHRRYREATREKVVAAASLLGYVSNRVALNLRYGKSNLLSLITPYSTPDIMDCMQFKARQYGYCMMLQCMPEPDPAMEVEYIRAALERRVDGIVWQAVNPYSPDKKVLNILKNSGIPVVVLQYPVAGFEEADLVRYDWEDGLAQGIRHLRECGYEKIVALVSAGNYEPIARRYKYYKKIADQENVPCEILRCHDAGDIIGMISEYLECQAGTIGFIAQHWAVLHLREAIERTGRLIPSEVGVVMLGDMVFAGQFPMSEMSRPRFSSVCMSAIDLAADVFELLINREQFHEKPVDKVVAVSLRQRESTMRLPGG